MAGKVSAAREKTESAILSAAEVEFEQHGFGGARLQRIADRAGVPKANVHYYFGNKQGLYDAVLQGVLKLWDDAFDQLHPEDDPREVLAHYVREKMRYSRENARAARILTHEILKGAPHLKDTLEGTLANWVHQRAGVIAHWVDEKKIAPLDPYHFIYFIWGSTQYYADYAVQIAAIHANEGAFDEKAYERATESVTIFILRACGLADD